MKTYLLCPLVVYRVWYDEEDYDEIHWETDPSFTYKHVLLPRVIIIHIPRTERERPPESSECKV